MANPIIIPVRAHVITAVNKVFSVKTVMVDQGRLRPPIPSPRRVSENEPVFAATASETKLRQYLKLASTIWSQADISFTLAAYETKTSEAPRGTRPGAAIDDTWSARLASEFPSEKGAISLIVVQRITQGTGGNSVEKISTTVLDEDAGPAIVAHEFGHLLGLCNGAKHDPRRDNLMYETLPFINAKLDAKQCADARSSPLARRFGAQP